MDIYSTQPIKEIDKLMYKNIVSNREIKVSPHALDHLSAGQRKVFKEEELISMVEKETPRKIYLQKNGRYAIYYRRSDGYRKLILDVENKEITIVTFMNTQELPKDRF